MLESDFIGVAVGFVLGIVGSMVGSLVTSALETRRARQTERRVLEKQVREELYPSLYAVIKSLSVTALDPVKDLAREDIPEDKTKVLAELLKDHQKRLETLIYERGVVAYLKPDPRIPGFDPKSAVFELYRDINVAITRINLQMRPYIQDEAGLIYKIMRLATYCEDRLEMQK